MELKEATRKERTEKFENIDFAGGTKTVGKVAVKIVFWGLSLFVLLFAIAAFATTGGVQSGMILYPSSATSTSSANPNTVDSIENTNE